MKMEHVIEEDKVMYFRKKILAWNQKAKRNFPWRSGKCSPYQIVIGEILLQRTRAEVVSSFFPEFITKYPSWTSLSSSSLVKLEDSLKPLGLWKRRALSLHSLANAVTSKGGELPASRQELESLPAIGQYIASAVLTLCYGKREPLLDVNMDRILERFFGPRKMADIRYDPYLQLLSRKVLSHGNARDINWAILDFAALVCKAKKPDHDSCVLASKCSYMNQS